MELTLRPATPADFPRIVAIVNAQMPEPMSVDELHRAEKLREPDDPFLRLVATNAEGTIVGSGVSGGGKYNKPGHFNLNVRVDHPYRRQGVGLALYGAFEAFAIEHGARRLDANVREQNAADWAWAERRGFVKEHHLFESKLNLATFDPTPFEDAVRAARDAGIRFISLAELGTDDATLHRYFEWLWEVSRDIPSADGQPKPPFAKFLEWIRENPRWDARNILFAVEGDHLAAMAELNLMESGALYHGMTGVQRDFRGRNLAIVIKLVAIARAKELGVPYLRTNNHSNNERMLAVNRKLGYEPEPGMFVIYKQLHTEA